MATYTAQCSKVGSFAYSQYFTLYVVLTNRNGNPATNKSIVDYNVYCQSSGSGSINAKHQLYFWIAGSTIRNETVTVNVSSPNAYIGIASGSIEVEHNSDGQKQITFEAIISGSSYGVYAQRSDTFTLTRIPRASTPTVSGTTIGSAMTITTNRADSSFTHTLTYKIGSLSGTIASSVGASTTWTIPASLANAIPNATTGTLTITCVTYNGSTNIGSKSITCTISVPSSYKPSISSIALSEAVSGLASKFGCYVQGKSKISGTVTASGSYSSTITAYKITINGATYTSKTFTTGVLNTTGSNTCSVTVTDSRGRTATSSTTFTVVAYSNPYITTFSVVRCNSAGTADENGAYARVVIKGGVSGVNSKNTYGYKLEYRKTGGSSYTTYSISNSAYTIDKTYTNIAVDTDSSYEFVLTISDYFTSTPRTVPLGSVFQLVNYNASGKGLAIGKVSEGDKFECGMDAEFTNATTFKKHVSFLTKADGKAYTATGWYRIAKITSGRGAFILNLMTNYNYTNNCSFIITVNIAHQTGKLNLLYGHENVENTISDVRLVRDTADDYYYIEIYYNKTVNNTVTADILSNVSFVQLADFGATTSTSSVIQTLTLQPGTVFSGTLRTSGSLTVSGNVTISGSSMTKGSQTIHGIRSLYYNESGSNGTITLSDSVANYTYIEIMFTDNQKAKNGSVRIYSANGKIADLHIIGSWYNTQANTDIRSRAVKISGTSISTNVDSTTSTNNVGYVQLYGTTIGANTHSNYMYITKVNGFV